MKRALGCLFALLIAISFTRVAVAISGPPFDFRLQLAVLHPEIYGHPQFQTWNTPIRLAAWSEEPRMPDGTPIVFVRAAGPPSGADTLAFRIQHHEDGTNTVLEVRSFSGAEVQVSYDDAVAALRTKSLQPITSAELSIDFAAATRLGWRLTTSTRSFDIRGGDIGVQDGLRAVAVA